MVLTKTARRGEGQAGGNKADHAPDDITPGIDYDYSSARADGNMNKLKPQFYEEVGL